MSCYFNTHQKEQQVTGLTSFPFIRNETQRKYGALSDVKSPSSQSTNWPNDPGCPNGQNQQMELSSNSPMQNTGHLLTAAALSHKEETGSTNNRADSTGCIPLHGDQPPARTGGSKQAGKGAQGTQQVGSPSAEIHLQNKPLLGSVSKTSPRCISRYQRQLHISKNVAFSSFQTTLRKTTAH